MRGRLRGRRLLEAAALAVAVCVVVSGVGAQARIAYLAPRGADLAIYVMNDDGSSSRRLTSGPDMWASWSPDGTQIAFSRWEGRMPQLYVMDAAGGGLHRVDTSVGEAADPKWSPDGMSIAFGTASGIRLINPNGDDERPFPGLPADTGSMAWAPNGRAVAFDRVVEGHFRLFILDLESGECRPLGSMNGSKPAWSPDGLWIAFYNSSSLGLIRADGTGLRWLEAHRPGLNEFPSWSPDGTQIAYESDQLGHESACVVDVVSGQFRRLVELGQFPVWCPIPDPAP